MNPDAQDNLRLSELFAELFKSEFNTVLVPAKDDPEYLPADDVYPCNRVCFAHGFFQSALHELAHWCLAGAARRQQVDYGYWYQTDGRSCDAQQNFYRVEARPQALEWVFSWGCSRLPFYMSLDNLTNPPTDLAPFAARILQAVDGFKSQGLPLRAERLFYGLSQTFGSAGSLGDFYHKALNGQLEIR